MTAPLTQNGYIFVENNPINFSDPAGLDTISVGGSLGWAGIVVGATLNISDAGLYGTGSLGLGTPGTGVSVTHSSGNPNVGNGVQAQVGVVKVAGLGAGVDAGGQYVEKGLNTPGYSGSVTSTIQLCPN